MTVNLNIVEKCVSCLNIKESYDLARRMEQEKTNPVLGYRTAGSLAERKTGDMLLEEMKKAGLTQVEKDKIRVDAWEFKKAVMRCHDREETCREIQLGAYQTDFKTNGFQRFDLVYLGKVPFFRLCRLRFRCCFLRRLRMRHFKISHSSRTCHTDSRHRDDHHKPFTPSFHFP